MFQQGQQIGTYTLIEKIGKGSFGEVWTAEKRTQFVTKKVAVKLPHNDLLDFEAIRQEATLWEEASGHPNVLPIIDADIYDGQVAIVSEYASGGSLSDRLKAVEKLPVREAVEMTIGILNGLEYLHSKKIIHRDIKPANILLQGEMPRLADFGISRAIETSTISSVVVGTESYMSPEAFDGKRNQQTDIWSVGVVLYQLLSGKLPFPQKRASEVMYAVLLKEPEPLKDIPPRLREIVSKALEKDQTPEEPPKRYQSASEMREDLKIFLFTLAQIGASTSEQSTAHQSEIKAAFSDTKPILNQETTAVAPAAQPETPTLVKEEPQNRSHLANLGQILTKKEVLPFVAIAVILVFFGIGSMIVRFGNQTVSVNSNTSNSVVSEQENIVSNSTDNANSNTAANINSLSNEAREFADQAYRQFQQKNIRKAIESYTKAIEISPNDFALYNDRGLVYYANRNYDKAIADFDTSIELNSASVTYNNRGVVYQDKGNREKAIADYNKALELDPTNEQAAKNLSDILK